MLSMPRIKHLILFSLAIPLSFSLQAQTRPGQSASGTDATVSSHQRMAGGVITDAVTGRPITGATVEYLDLAAALTDSTGTFSIEVPDYQVTLLVAADGYLQQEVALKGHRHMRTSLFTEGADPYQQVVLPFSAVPESHLSAAVSPVSVGGNWQGIPEGPDNYLQGKVSGLKVTRRSGTPGIGANMLLRGYTSLYGTNQPLIVIDGIPYDISSYGNSIISGYYQDPLSYIDVKDIDEITVIKDGGSLYGTKGANGVILITTARSQEEATRIDAALYGSVNTVPENLPVLNARDYRIYLSEMLQSQGLTAKQRQTLPYMDDNTTNPAYYGYHDQNNWQKKIYQSSASKNGYLKISGGDNIAKYALSIGFMKNEGIVKNTDRTRYNTRFNADLNLSKRLTASANLSFSYAESNLKNQGLALSTNPIYSALVKAPFLSVHVKDAKGISSPDLADADTFGISNPVALINDVQAFNRSYRFVGSIALKYKLLKNLDIQSELAATMDKVRESFFIPQKGIVPDTLSDAIAKNHSGAQVLRMFSFFNDTRVSYHNTFDQIHVLSLNLGVQYLHETSEQDEGFGFNSATDELTGVGYGLSSLRSIGGSLGEYKWLNDYFSADYALRGKYFFSFNVSMDGSSRFGNQAHNGPVVQTGSRNYALMPSVSGAWIISSENFMAHSSWIDLLKLRASVGRTGNDDIGNFNATQYYVSQNLLGMEGLVRGNVGNQDLGWESVTNLNGGLDLSLFQHRLSLSADVYRKSTDGMIVYKPAPAASGMQYSLSNSGAMKTTGWEAGVDVRVLNAPHFTWNLGLNIAGYRSRITRLPGDRQFTDYAGGTILTAVGDAPNLFYGYKTDGVYSSDADARAQGLSVRQANGTLAAFSGGDVRFINQDASDKVIDSRDRQVIGDPNPDVFGSVSSSLTWKKWSLDALFTFTEGGDIYNYTRRQLESMSGYENQSQAVLNRWQTNGQKTDIPRLSWGDPMGNSRFSDRWIEDGSYFRLRSLAIGYKLPFTRGALKYIAVYLTGNNVFTLTRYLGYDPELSPTLGPIGQGVDIMEAPQFRTIQLGIRLGL